MAATTKIQAKPTEAGTTPKRVAALRDLAATDAAEAQRETWDWFKELGKLTASDRSAGEAKLEELFGCGRASGSIDGQTDGILVAPLIQPVVDAIARRLTSVWMPWMGKRFNASTQLGDNRLTGQTRFITRLLWPRYSTRPTDGGRLAFDFEMRVEPGAIEPAVDVLVIDYEPIDSNPKLIIRSIRDELVEIVPGTHLGRILYRTDSGYNNIGYFALRTPVG